MLVSMVMTNVWYCPKHALHFMKAKYYLEHTIYCLFLYVSEENGCSSSKMPKDRVFHFWLPHPLWLPWLQELEDLKVLRCSPDLLNNVKIGQD